MDNNSFYKPTGDKVAGMNATYVPDLYRQVAEEMLAEQCEASSRNELHRMLKIQNRPMIGVLYSISAGIEGELFPVYVGRNTIGSDTSCDICLLETSVSANHGLMLARKQTNSYGEEYISVVLSDNNSSYGTMVNSEKLSFDKVECNDGDVITIGNNYVLILSLFNAINKLTVAHGFDRIQSPSVNFTSDEERQATAIAEIEQSPIADVAPALPDECDHSTNITKDPNEDASLDFYKPTKKQGQDHYNNKTRIL